MKAAKSSGKVREGPTPQPEEELCEELADALRGIVVKLQNSDPEHRCMMMAGLQKVLGKQELAFVHSVVQTNGKG